MGSRGPVPKRDDQRIRRNTPEVETSTITAIGVVQIPELNLGDDVHPLVVDLYQSMKDSAQSKYMEASDWALARATLFLLDGQLKAEKKSAMMINNIFSTLTSDLLVSEGARRRARIEVERKDSGALAPVAQISDHYKSMLGVAPAQ